MRNNLTAVALLSLAACEPAPPPIKLHKYCVSDSGMSKYWLTLDTIQEKGAIKYNYMDQDALYIVRMINTEGRNVSGTAEFLSSSTGEKRGNPIIFQYNFGSETFVDGSISASCQDSEANIILN